jgi:hypothetical protein
MSDLRDALKTLRDANMSYSLVSDVKNARRLEQAMRDAEAALAQPEAVEPVAVHYLHTHPEHGEDVSRQRLTESDKKYGWAEQPLFTTPPTAPDERMRRALAAVTLDLIECADKDEDPLEWESVKQAYAVLGIPIGEALSRADKGKESEGVVMHQARKTKELVDSWSDAKQDFSRRATGCHSDPTPPDATAQREAIARIIDPEAFENWDRAEGSWRKDEARVKCEDAEAKADAIIALQTRAGG